MTGPKKPVIGLAGGIASGKSAVAHILAELGCVVADADALGHEALGDPAIRSRLVEWWGPSILDENGEVKRRALAGIVFRDPAERKRLESLVHPWIEARRRELFARAPADAPALVIDAPLLFEAGLNRICEAVIYVEAPQKVRQERVVRERGWAHAELLLREQGQMPLDEKRKRADHMVSNERGLGELKVQVLAVLQTILHSR